MGLVSMKSILEDASKGGYGVPAIDALDYESAEAIIMAAEDADRPVILMVPESGLMLVDQENYFDFLVYRCKKANVPVAIELDHGEDMDVIQEAIDAGFTGVMYDGSSLPLEENIANTKKVVEMAREKGVSVEAEIGHVGGGEGNLEQAEVDRDLFTKPEDAKYFVEQTGVDALAVAVGTVHGFYKGEPNLDFERLSEINSMIDIPLVLHGGSGVSDEDFVKAIENGINKINLFTEFSNGALNKAVDYTLSRERKVHFAEMIFVGKMEVQDLAEKYLDLFGLGK